MTAPTPLTDPSSAEYVAYEEFRNGLLRGRFHVIVDPALARSFVAQRLHATPVAIAIVGCGVASALGGYPLAGALLVVAGVFLRRTIKWQAAKILLQLAIRQPITYYDATSLGVMEVRRA